MTVNEVDATLLVSCSGRACRNVVEESKKLEGVTLAFEVQRQTTKDPGAIVSVSGSQMQIDNAVRIIGRISGVTEVSQKIGRSIYGDNGL
ncbi:MAG: hypothetical protein ACRD8W_27985 [Nitrososphaeraceae archaeon]